MATIDPVRFLDRATPPHIFTLIVLTGLGALSMNIFLPSLPQMTEYFVTDYRLMQLSVALYLAVNAGLQILIGPISDRYGRRPVLLVGVSVFLLATLGCILAPNIEVFLFFRMLQAVIVVGLVLGRAVVRDMYPADQAASQIGYVTMGMAVVPMIGPAIGGVLDETFGWQANFWLLFILGIMVLVLTWRDLGETARATSTSFAAQFREYPELLTSRRFWGYCMAAAFASGAFFSSAFWRAGRLCRRPKGGSLVSSPSLWSGSLGFLSSRAPALVVRGRGIFFAGATGISGLVLRSGGDRLDCPSGHPVILGGGVLMSCLSAHVSLLLWLSANRGVSLLRLHGPSWAFVWATHSGAVPDPGDTWGCWCGAGPQAWRV